MVLPNEYIVTLILSRVLHFSGSHEGICAFELSHLLFIFSIKIIIKILSNPRWYQGHSQGSSTDTSYSRKLFSNAIPPYESYSLTRVRQEISSLETLHMIHSLVMYGNNNLILGGFSMFENIIVDMYFLCEYY